MRNWRFIIAATVCWGVFAQHSDADDSKDAMIIETILRLNDFDLEGSEKAQVAVARYLKSNWGGDRYFDLIRRFELKQEVPGILKLALEKPDSPAGAEAAVLLVELGAQKSLSDVLHGSDQEAAMKAAKAISQSRSEELVKQLESVMNDTERPSAVRAAALTGIYGSSPKRHEELMATVKSGELANDLKQAASDVLMLSRDAKIREQAQALFSAGEDAYPPIAELVKRKGDPENGKKLFTTKTCMVCHVAEGVGINFGPGLSEIGDKLSKTELYSAIIEPSAGISMGFEGWEVTLKDGTQLLGIIEEAEDKVTVNMIGGASRTVLSEEVSSKKKLEQSLMYPGLHKMMSPDEMVDLVEYLSALKKTPEK